MTYRMGFAMNQTTDDIGIRLDPVTYKIVAVNGLGFLTFKNIDDMLGTAKTLLEAHECIGVTITKEPHQNSSDANKWYQAVKIYMREGSTHWMHHLVVEYESQRGEE